MQKSKFPSELSFLIGVTFLFVMCYQIFDPILPLYMREVGATELDVGLMLAASTLVGVILRIPFGMASDRFGRKSVIPISLGAQFASIILLYLVSHPLWFYPVLAFQALPMSLYWSSAAALASDMAPLEKRGEAIGRYFTGFGLAMFSGPFLCSFLTTFLNYRSVLLVLFPFPVISTAIFLKKLANQNKEFPERFQGKKHSVLASLKRIFKSDNVKTLYVVQILNSVPLGIFAALFSIYSLETLLFTPSLISLLFTARGGANALIRMPVGRFSDRIGSRKYLLILSSGFHVLAYTIMSITGNYFLLVSAMIVFGLGWGMRVALDNTLLVENLDNRDRGLALSISIASFGAGQFLGSAFAGFATSFLLTNDVFKLAIPLYLSSIIVLTLAIREKTE